MKNPTKSDRYDEIGIASLPRDRQGFIDERELIRLCGKAKLPLSDLYDLYPYEFIFYIEGYLENQREYFEYLNYSLFNSIRQALGNKKKFENPFEKKEMPAEQRKLTEEEYESEIENVKGLFNLWAKGRIYRFFLYFLPFSFIHYLQNFTKERKGKTWD